MSKFDADELEDKPLDPAMENVRRKMVRLQLVSGGIMLVMFMAVLAAIVYKVTRTDGKPESTLSAGLPVPSDAPLTGAVTLPDGFAVSSVSQSGGQILFYGVLADGARKAILFDIAAGRIVADIDVNGR
ncbi:hypothetical protein OCK02_06420 [Rhizobium sp. TRM96647]|uniref:hypothetical protein n=1 Tax=unclassified Rhizobium TaxID=2613769 RepID=UPI0021E77D19|nr:MULTISPECIES: hypothetical protein [unclassified Rhizobium]MCV3735831.1 hypothetical protein [Rhizobium sp. TRM96647]MCV3758507.1 hypothetical protein [Rhizobium sp. TRM96650]